MPVRIKITLLFAVIVLAILILVCGSVYYFSYRSRINNITTRLTNRAITTARLISQSEIFDPELIRKIDSSTTLALADKEVEVYDSRDKQTYVYTDKPGNALKVDTDILNEARVKGKLYFTRGEKDVIAYHAQIGNYKSVMVVAAIDKDGKEKLHQLRLIILFSFIGGMLIATGGGYFFSRGLLLPVRKIMDEVNEISANSLARRINEGPVKDEWNYLSSTLNQLLNRLQDSFEVQGRFISNASHELLTPLTSISSQLEVSLQRDRAAEQYRSVMESIYQDTRHLSKLTQTLLEFAKASGNQAGIEIDLLRIDEILLRLPGEIAKQNALYSVFLIFNQLPPEEEKLLVFGNEELLFSAIKNIASNACKYSEDRKAKVSLGVMNGEAIIQVIDNGPGISGEEIEKIFQPFYRINNETEVDGFGLGLSLANRIIKLHKGSISISSVVGHGTTFTIKLFTGTSKRTVK